MPKLTPSHANAIVLFGQEACNGFAKMVEYWNTILAPSAWSHFVFLLVGKDIDAPQVPPELEEKIRQDCWILDIEKAGDAAQLSEIADALRERLSGVHVLLQCICTDFADGQAAADVPIRLARLISGEFTKDMLQTIFYLLLDRDVAAAGAQRAFLAALEAEQSLPWYTYLLSREVHDGSLVSRSSVWRTVYCETLANSAQLRVLSNKTFYSLGLSTLNADDNELRSLRVNQMTDRLLLRAEAAFTDQEAWQVLTQSDNQLEGTGDAVLRQKVAQWMNWWTGRQTEFPGKQEKRNNRVLSDLYAVDVAQSKAAIHRFYQLNYSDPTKMEGDAARRAREQLAAIKHALARRVNLPAFPQGFLERVIQMLEDMEKARTPRKEVVLPKKRMTTSQKAYIDECCEQLEACEEENLRVAYRKCYAGAFRSALRELLEFLENAKEITVFLAEQKMAPAEFVELQEKYPKYWAGVKEVDRLQHETLISKVWLEQNAPFYGAEGYPLEDTWRRLIAEGERRMHRNLPAGFTGTFCQTLSQEYGFGETLASFFGQYLSASKRMFYSIHDAVGDPQELFFADEALARHPWLEQQYKGESVLSQNDNVVRVDLFRLDRGAREFLEAQDERDNRYFGSAARGAQSESGLRRAFSQASRGGQGKDGGTAQAPEGDAVVPPVDGAGGKRLSLVYTEGKYVLVWPWAERERNAIIEIWKDGSPPYTYPCSVDEFNARVGECPRGVDVSIGLPAGKINVKVTSGNDFCLQEEMVGRQSIVQYKLESDPKKGCRLIVSGAPRDIRQLVLQAGDGSGRVLLYPIDPAPKKEKEPQVCFEGLFLNIRESELRAAPGEDFPTVRAVVRNGGFH